MPTDRCRIFIFTQNDWFFHLHFLALGRALVNAGLDVVLACKVDRHREHLEAAGLRVHAVHNLDVRSLGPREQLKTVRELTRLMRREQPAVTLLISPKPVVLGSMAAKLAHVPAVLSLMTGLGFLFADESSRLQLLQRIVLAVLRYTHGGHGRRILFQNSLDRTLLINSGVIDERRAPLVGGVGTELDRFKPGDRKNDPPVIVFGARMIRDKGVVDLVDAARILQQRGVACRVLLCGDPDPGNPNSLEEAELLVWQEEGIVEWLGHVDAIETVLSTADIACLPTYYREGLPKFLLDAAAAGLPLVSTDAPGCEDVITHGENGLIVPKRNPEALANALEKLVLNRDVRKRMGRASRTRAEREFSEDAFVERVFSVLREVASELDMPRCGVKL